MDSRDPFGWASRPTLDMIKAVENLNSSRIDDFMEAVEEARKQNASLGMFSRVFDQVRVFQDGLSPDEEVGICHAAFGVGVITVKLIGSVDPDIIFFVGSDEHGREVRLVQHMSQVSILLVAVKVQGQRTARRLGFDV